MRVSSGGKPRSVAASSSTVTGEALASRKRARAASPTRVRSPGWTLRCRCRAKRPRISLFPGQQGGVDYAFKAALLIAHRFDRQIDILEAEFVGRHQAEIEIFGGQLLERHLTGAIGMAPRRLHGDVF